MKHPQVTSKTAEQISDNRVFSYYTGKTKVIQEKNFLAILREIRLRWIT